MKPNPNPVCSAHRLARLVALVGAVLAWLALGAPCLNAAQRRHHKRFGRVSVGWLTRTVRDLIILEGAQYLPARAAARRYGISPPRGVRRVAPRLTPRRAGGAWVRRKLYVSGGFLDVVLHLVEMLRQLRDLGAYVGLMLRRGFMRIAPLILVRPQTQTIETLCAEACFAINSS